MDFCEFILILNLNYEDILVSFIYFSIYWKSSFLRFNFLVKDLKYVIVILEKLMLYIFIYCD